MWRIARDRTAPGRNLGTEGARKESSGGQQREAGAWSRLTDQSEVTPVRINVPAPLSPIPSPTADAHGPNQ